MEILYGLSCRVVLYSKSTNLHNLIEIQVFVLPSVPVGNTKQDSTTFLFGLYVMYVMHISHFLIDSNLKYLHFKGFLYLFLCVLVQNAVSLLKF